MSLELEAPGVAGCESVLAAGEREAGSWRGNPGCSELEIRSTMLDKQSRLDKELLSVAYTKNTKKKKTFKKSPNIETCLCCTLHSRAAPLTPRGQMVTENLI